MKYSFICALFALTTSAYASLPEASISGDATSPSALASVPNSVPANLDQNAMAPAMAENHENRALPNAPRHTGVIDVEWKKEGDFSKININDNQIRSVSYTPTTPNALVEEMHLIEYAKHNEPVLLVFLQGKYLPSKDFLEEYEDPHLKVFPSPFGTVELSNANPSELTPLSEFLDFLAKNKILSENDIDMIASDAAQDIPWEEKEQARKEAAQKNLEYEREFSFLRTPPGSTHKELYENSKKVLDEARKLLYKKTLQDLERALQLAEAGHTRGDTYS